MKKLNFVIFILVVFISGFAGTQSVSAQDLRPAQSSCGCSVGSCSASQSCPDGYIAVCTCSADGCSSSCTKTGFAPELDEKVLAAKLQVEIVKNYGSILSKAFGKIVTFEPISTKFRFDYSSSNSSTASHWDVLDYLEKNGNLKINGHNLEFWRGLRQTLLNGGEFNFCTGNAPAEMILAQISFITGRKYSIVSGNPQTKVSEPIKGLSLAEIIESLSKAGKITIVEN